jgi:hypothetical protein
MVSTYAQVAASSSRNNSNNNANCCRSQDNLGGHNVALLSAYDSKNRQLQRKGKGSKLVLPALPASPKKKLVKNDILGMDNTWASQGGGGGSFGTHKFDEDKQKKQQSNNSIVPPLQLQLQRKPSIIDTTLIVSIPKGKGGKTRTEIKRRGAEREKLKTLKDDKWWVKNPTVGGEKMNAQQRVLAEKESFTGIYRKRFEEKSGGSALAGDFFSTPRRGLALSLSIYLSSVSIYFFLAIVDR